MKTPYYWTNEEEAEIRSLIIDGYDIPELLELFTNPMDRTKNSIMSKIYNTLDTIPGAKEKMFAKRKAERAALKNLAEQSVVQKTTYEGVVKNETDEAKKLRLSRTQLIAIEKRVPELKYPMVAKYVKTNSNYVVMFTSLHRCVVLVPGESGLAAGHVSETLGACNDTEYWDILDSATIKFTSL
jgi:hypothetical protein